jgi:hypothetical protein
VMNISFPRMMAAPSVRDARASCRFHTHPARPVLLRR